MSLQKSKNSLPVCMGLGLRSRPSRWGSPASGVRRISQRLIFGLAASIPKAREFAGFFRAVRRASGVGWAGGGAPRLPHGLDHALSRPRGRTLQTPLAAGERPPPQRGWAGEVARPGVGAGRRERGAKVGRRRPGRTGAGPGRAGRRHRSRSPNPRRGSGSAPRGREAVRTGWPQPAGRNWTTWPSWSSTTRCWRSLSRPWTRWRWPRWTPPPGGTRSPSTPPA